MAHQHCDREQGLGPSCVVAPLGSFSISGRRASAGAACAGPSDMWRLLRAYINHSMLVYFLSPWMFCNAFSIQWLILFIITFQQLPQSGICTDVLNFAMFSLA